MTKSVILVTGGAGFIGANFIYLQQDNPDLQIVNLDKLTYAGNMVTLANLASDDRHIFVRGDIGDRQLVDSLLERYQPQAIVNFAAETHVDRSIDSPANFVETNVTGTFNLLESARKYWQSLDKVGQNKFRFLHISTDEVFGSLSPTDPAFTETTPYTPNSPYSASKASSDHFVRAYFHTYGLPTLITNCSNNYGSYQFPEKLIPLTILNAILGKPLPIYGDGQNIRDWLFVEDHCRAIDLVLNCGVPGETYNVGGGAERTNIWLVNKLCEILDEFLPESAHLPHNRSIIYVTDRPGHDRRYAIDFTKLHRDLGWQPQEDIESGLRKTVRWYLANQAWCQQVTADKYDLERLGLNK
ncbi:dTDP-glucose 4,6-dehydratase [Chamaesiphon sp. VAR_48_metabat_135_sub]|uniref:dTDP-glucose 4,6-dehydratase n=1 Tax=Chamaesiphon sp. VAR_48_metabat_135_sub TaxID=2964699 RepID=UPI00286CD9DB|nr:dTDP-glucose 4,6-dehydratase [Chamaesiphon sp. VAR_48_metabat_135_sub]